MWLPGGGSPLAATAPPAAPAAARAATAYAPGVWAGVNGAADVRRRPDDHAREAAEVATACTPAVAAAAPAAGPAAADLGVVLVAVPLFRRPARPRPAGDALLSALRCGDGSRVLVSCAACFGQRLMYSKDGSPSAPTVMDISIWMVGDSAPQEGWNHTLHRFRLLPEATGWLHRMHNPLRSLHTKHRMPRGQLCVACRSMGSIASTSTKDAWGASDVSAASRPHLWRAAHLIHPQRA